MARTKRSAKLDSRESRKKLPSEVRHQEPLSEGRYLVYRRPKNKSAGSWMGRLYDPETKKDIQKRLGIADDYEDADGKRVFDYSQAQKKAQKWFDQARAEATGERLHSGPYTVRDAWEDYAGNAERRGMKSIPQTESVVKAHILPALGVVPVEKLTKKRIQLWHSNLSKASARVRSSKGAKKPATRPAPKTEDELRARRDTANRVLTILKAMLNEAREEHHTFADGNAWKEVKPFPETTKARIRFLSVDESQRLVNVCPPDFRRLVQGALFTGARFGELVRLQVRDCNREAGTVFIAESKSGKERHVVLTEEGQIFFQEITAGLKGDGPIFTREAFPDMRRVRPVSQEPMPKVVCAWKRGDQSRFMAAACKAAGLEAVSFHELRHSYASSLVNAGVPLAFIAKQLGHANTTMTEKHYAHLAPSAMAEAIRTLAPKLGIHEPGKIAGLKIKVGAS